MRYDFTFYGGAREFVKYKDECILHGPAETGKTISALHKLHFAAIKYDNASIVITRRTLSSAYSTVIQAFENKVLFSPKRWGVKPYGGKKPEWYDYPNGSRIWVTGLDKASKVLSAEHDIIYVNQAEEFELDEWEILTTRATGRAGNMPYAQTMGDANPAYPSFWMYNREGLKLFYSEHRDNPVLFDQETGEITEQGKRTMAILNRLTGARRDRLLDGKPSAIEGAIYTEYQVSKHLMDWAELPKLVNGELPTSGRYFVSIDFGYTHAFSASLWYVEEGIAYLARQIYYTKRTVEEHCPSIKDMIQTRRDTGQVDENGNVIYSLHQLQIEAWITDHDAEARATLEKHLNIITTPAYKSVKPGIENVKGLLKSVKIKFVRGVLVEIDHKLQQAKLPTCTVDEITGYRWNNKKQDTPIKEDDHGVDEMRYFAAYWQHLGHSKTFSMTPTATIDNYARSER